MAKRTNASVSDNAAKKAAKGAKREKTKSNLEALIKPEGIELAKKLAEDKVYGIHGGAVIRYAALFCVHRMQQGRCACHGAPGRVCKQVTELEKAAAAMSGKAQEGLLQAIYMLLKPYKA